MDLKKRLQQERETGLGNIVDKPWFLVVVFLIFVALIGPEAYRHFKNPTIEDCTDTLYMKYNGLDWSPTFLERSVSEKLNGSDELFTANGTTYESTWNDCEEELKQYPKKFNAKYKNSKMEIESAIKTQKEWIALRKK